MDREELNGRALLWRRASAVTRCHTLTWIGSYSVGQHSHDMLSLLFLLHPNPSPRLIRIIHFHDYHEVITGDIPAPTLWDDGELTSVLARAAHGANVVLKIDGELEQPSDEEMRWVIGLDRLELWIAGCQQTAMGNGTVHPMMHRLEAWLDENDVPDPIRDFWEQFEWRSE